jgi:CRISPR-associated protein Cmr1
VIIILQKDNKRFSREFLWLKISGIHYRNRYNAIGCYQEDLMEMQMEALNVRIRTLTPIWTGGIEGKCDRLHETGIIGSLRWWYEAIIRGLEGYACDPTDEGCKLDGTEKNDAERKKKICPVCYLFGCTGWQRKFRFEIRKDEDGSPGSLKLGKIIDDEKLWLCFLPLKQIDLIEKSLLIATLRICSRYGAIGGKTTYKPSENADKNGCIPHKDFGLFEIESEMTNEKIPMKIIKSYLKNFNSKRNHPSWPDLRYFWFTSKTLNRLEINNIVGRTNKGDYLPKTAEWQKWLGGDKRDSKKIFSFYTKGGERTWGYFNKENYEKAKQELKNTISSQIIWGEGVLNEFFS